MRFAEFSEPDSSLQGRDARIDLFIATLAGQYEQFEDLDLRYLCPRNVTSTLL